VKEAHLGDKVQARLDLKGRILVADDDEAVLRAVERPLAKAGLRLFPDGRIEALGIVGESEPEPGRVQSYSRSSIARLLISSAALFISRGRAPTSPD